MSEPKYGTPEWDEYVRKERISLEIKHGQVWDTDEVQRDFVVESFLAPFVFVKRRSDGIRGTMIFQHSPRFYFDFKSSDNTLVP